MTFDVDIMDSEGRSYNVSCYYVTRMSPHPYPGSGYNWTVSLNKVNEDGEELEMPSALGFSIRVPK